MDFSTMRAKVQANGYTTWLEFQVSVHWQLMSLLQPANSHAAQAH